MNHRARCVHCQGNVRRTGATCARCRAEQNPLHVGKASYVSSHRSPRVREARVFTFYGISLLYTEIAALADVKMNTIQKRVSAGTPLFATRMRRVA